MFKPHFGICICHKEKRLIVVKKGYCAEGNYEKKQKNKNTNKLQGSSINKARCSISKKFKLSPSDKRKFVRSFQSSTKPTGEKEMFQDIAAEREWVCFVTGIGLSGLKAQQFAHVLAKALNKYPLFKLYKKNIVILSDEIHYAWDFKPRSELRKDPRFDKLFELEEELKQEYKLCKK